MRLRIVAFIILIVPNLLFAEIYKWQDENGRWQYSDTPPEHKNIAPLPSDQLPHIHSLPAPEEIQFNNGDSRNEINKISVQRNKAPSGICKQLRQRLKSINASLRSGYSTGAKGDRLRKSRRKTNALIRKNNC